MSEPADAELDPRICDKGGKGLFLPLSSNEYTWPTEVRGPMYGFAMAYCFLGVSIVADTFMEAIEAVTSRRRKVRLKDGRIVTARVWNDTVANLTLMALGSSAPEILLSVIELFKRDMYAGELGPSTIVGSAAFNLFVIVALCIVVIPNNDYRKVRELPVLYITAVFSLFAYLWLVVILSLITPDIVDFWEALVTFLAFPVLVYISWLADTGKLGQLLRRRQTVLAAESVPDEVLRSIIDRLGAKDEHAVEIIKKGVTEANLSSESSTVDIEALVNSLKPQLSRNGHAGVGRKSRATHRIEAIRAFTGSKRAHGRRGSCMSAEAPAIGQAEHEANQIMFTCDRQWLSRNVSQKPVALARVGDANFDVKVEYAVHLIPSAEHRMKQTPSAMSDMECPSKMVTSLRSSWPSSNASSILQPTNYAHADENMFAHIGREISSGTFLFQAGETRADILVERPSGIPPGQCEDFLVRLKTVEAIETGHRIGIGVIGSTQVNMAPDRAPGRLAFVQECLNIQASSEVQKTQAVVVRKGGCCGAVSVNYKTEKHTALPGYDYKEASGVLDFADGVTELTIELEILPKGPNQCTDEFLVLLEDPTGGASFDPQDDGGEDCSILTVTINALDVGASSSAGHNVMRWIDNKVFNLAELKVGTEDWKDQFAGAVYCNGSKEDQAEASSLDWTFHLVSLPWKLLFTLVPPTTFCNGWLCFYTSLAMIGIVTGVIGDLAELFGCTLDVPDAVTAITFVALGTSMPDLFASQSAAIQDPWADASICNVTGSNSVNVFLGLGLPWTLGAIHWNVTKRTTAWESRYPEIAEVTPVGDCVFVVEAKSLAFSVLIYAGASLAALGMLQLRRNRLGFELGGPWKEKVSSGVAFLVLWFGYLVLVSWQVLRKDKTSDVESYTVFISVCVVVVMFIIPPVVLLCRYEAPEEEYNSDEVDEEAMTKPATETVAQDGVRDTEVVECEPGDIGKDPFIVAPPDIAAGMPVLKGGLQQETPLSVIVELSHEYRSPPLAVISEFDLEFGDRPVAQPPCTPSAKLELMLDPSNAGTQDSNDNGFPTDIAGRFTLSEVNSPPVAHLPNVTRDAALLDPWEGGARRNLSPYFASNGEPPTCIGLRSGADGLQQAQGHELLLSL